MDIIYYTIAIIFLLDVKYIAELRYKMDSAYSVYPNMIAPPRGILWYYVFTFLVCVLRIVFVYAVLTLIDSFPSLISNIGE